MTSKYVYLKLTYGGRSLAAGGRHWVQMPITESQPMSMTDFNLSSALSSLEQPGASVSAIGTRTIDGQSCTGYAVSPASQAGSPQSATLVWAGSDQLLCQVSIGIQERSVSAAGQIVISFMHYGAPVHISAPAQSDTASGQQWLSTLGREATAT